MTLYYWIPTRSKEAVWYSRVSVRHTATVGDVMIAETMDDPWQKMTMPDNIYSPFDHIFGESEHVTYNVKIVDQAACPATVDVRGRPRFYAGGERPEHRRFGIVVNTDDPSKAAAPPPLDQRLPAAEISVTLAFDGSDCHDKPQKVTVYGVTDWDQLHSLSSYVILRHTLTRKGGADANETGPVLKLYAVDRYTIGVAGAVPANDGSPTLQTRHFTKHYAPMRATYADNVGPSAKAGHGIPSTQQRWNDETHVLLPRPPDNSTEAPWIEFCIYVQGIERSDDSEGNIQLPRKGRSTVGLPQLTLIPFEYEQRFWAYFDNYLPDRINRHFGLPIEIEAYEAIFNGRSSCQLTGTLGANYDESKWQTLYAGGPATLKTDGTPAAWPQTYDPFEIARVDWDKMVNVRMRSVYGVSTGIADNDDDMHRHRVTVNGNEHVYRRPGGIMLLKFTFAEIMGAFSDGSIVIRFD